MKLHRDLRGITAAVVPSGKITSTINMSADSWILYKEISSRMCHVCPSLLGSHTSIPQVLGGRIISFQLS